MLIGYMYIPASVAVFMQKIVHREPLSNIGLRWPNRWWVAAWLTPPILAIATTAFSLTLPGVFFSPEMDGFYQRIAGAITPEQLEQVKEQARLMPVHPFFLASIQALVAGITINSLAALGEEMGWRGYLQNQLLPLGFWRCALIIGIIWGLWHAPLTWHGYNYPQHPGVVAVIMMTLWTILAAPLFSWTRKRTGSVLGPAILHGTINGSFGLSIMLISGGDDLSVGFVGMAGLITMTVVSLFLWLTFKQNNRIVWPANTTNL
jgi:membrane protease YdiL (CAAX protease family)